MIIIIDEKGNVLTYIDSTHIVYADRKGHASLFLIMGKGVIINILKKLSLVITRSTEIEIVLNSKRFSKCI